MKSQERRMKSSRMRLEKCLRSAHVPTELSVDSSYVCRSICRDENEDDDEMSECIWCEMAWRCVVGQTIMTSVIESKMSHISLRLSIAEDAPLIPARSSQLRT